MSSSVQNQNENQNQNQDEEKSNNVVPWSTHDPACSHCRLRKIRCGRERPQCSNCKRDSVQCDFSDNGKRVNHIKLLVNNFGGLETRLANIEKELETLTGSLQKGGARCAPISPAEDSSPASYLDTNFFDDDDDTQQPIDHFVVRRQEDGIDQYHSPYTLLALCRDFRKRLLQDDDFKTPQRLLSALSDEQQARHDRIKAFANNMCSTAAMDEPLHLNSRSGHPIVLPPKYFLTMSCPTFFRREDLVLDIFCQSNFWANAHRIYSKALSPADEPWALCFTMIILLVLGAEQADKNNGDSAFESQYSAPLIASIRYATTCTKLLTTPKLINLQALILLIAAAEQHLDPSISETLLAQACILAKRIGVHQQCVYEDGTSPDENEERSKVFRSLFLRDKSLAISRGMNCWLPITDCSAFIELERRCSKDKTSELSSRLELARLQTEVCRMLHSHSFLGQSASQRNCSVFKLEQGFQQWADTHKADSAELGPSTDIKLEFYACRLMLLLKSSTQKHADQAINAARASCHLLCTATGFTYGKASEDGDSPSRLEMDTDRPVTKDGQTRKRSSASMESLPTPPSEQPQLRIRSFLESFPSVAFFVIAQHILQDKQESTMEGDVKLLLDVYSLFQELESKAQAYSYTRRLALIFHNTIAILRILKGDFFPKDQQTSPVTPDMDFLQFSPDSAFFNSQLPPPYPELSLDLTSSQPTNFFNGSLGSASTGMPDAINLDTFDADHGFSAALYHSQPHSMQSPSSTGKGAKRQCVDNFDTTFFDPPHFTFFSPTAFPITVTPPDSNFPASSSV